MADVVAGPWASQIWITSIYGPILVGEALVVPLCGLLLGRFWTHLNDEELWNEHSKRYRAFLYAITALVCAYTILVIEEVCYWGTLQQRSLEVILRGHHIQAVIPPLGGLISALVSATLAYRASGLFSRGPRWIFLFCVGGLICAGFSGSLLVMYNTIRYLHDEEATTSFTFNNSISLWMSTSAAADVGISVALWLKLRSQLGAGFEVTDSVLRTLTRVGLRTAGYTSIFALIAAGLSAFPEDDLRTTCAVYAAFLPLPCLSGLSLFTTLQSRRTVRDKVTLSLAGNLDSFFTPASPHIRPQPSPLSSQLGQPRFLMQEKEQDWNADAEKELEEELASAPSKDSDQLPV